MAANVKHSSKNDAWITPQDVVDAVWQFCDGAPDFDPASCEEHNRLMKAKRLLTREDDALGAKPWPVRPSDRVWLNPPGGKIGNASVAGLFWERLIAERDNYADAIFLGFTVELLRTSQHYGPVSAMSFPFCVPRRRLRFLSLEDGELRLGASPPHANCIIYVPGLVDRTSQFPQAFSSLGDVIVPFVSLRRHGL